MCGILGFTGKKNSKKVKDLLKIISHRGYDEQIADYSDQINIGMNRLSINDLTKGYYPFQYKHFSLVFNGEIYNYLELKKKLEKKGVSFKTTCDAEVILPLFNMFGVKSFAMLEGMYAICIINKKSKQVILVRDKSGEKPIYYSFFPDKSFVFASEKKVILSMIHQKTINKKTLALYLHNGSIHKTDTLTTGIKKILAAQYLQYDIQKKTTKVKSYWKPNSSLKKWENVDPITKLDSLIKKSVQQRLLADVPIGSFLSGGVDSSLVSYHAARELGKINTFSVSFPNSKKDDESKYSRLISKYINSNHSEVTCSVDRVRKVIDELPAIIDEPIVDPAVLPTYLLAKEARKSVKVVLTGEGADELFAGYYRYHKHFLLSETGKIIKKVPFLPSVRAAFFPQRLKRIFSDLDSNYSPLNVWKSEEIFQLTNLSIKNKKILKKKTTTDPLLFMQLTDLKSYLPEQLLMKVDKITMQHNLEARAPFLDSQIISFALSLPPKYKRRFFHSKFILRKVADSYLPSSVVWRLKHGFSVPLNQWFRNELKDVVYDSYNQLKPYQHYFNLKYYFSVIEEHMEERENHRDKIWSMICLSRWLNYHQFN